MRYLIKITLLSLLLTTTIFAKDVATVTGLNGSASVDRDAKSISIKLGDKLRQKDTIVTGSKAKVQIIFDDNTIVTIGKDSKFSINEYMFEDSQEPEVKFGLLKGAMRTITGKIGKIAPDRFSVATKTAMIGIRGTNFTIVERENGTQNIFCTYGAISVSVNGVESVVNQGFYADIVQGGVVSVKEFTPKELKSMQDSSFASAKSSESKDGATDGLEATSGEGQIDMTKDDISASVVIKDITNSISDASQMVAPKSGQYHFSDGVSYRISANEFVADDSWVKTNFKNFQGDIDEWTFKIQRTPTSFISNDSFSTTLSSATINSTASSRNPKILSSEFVATGDDLASGDAMSWGRWSASVEYNYGVASARANDMSALWIAGEPTASSVIDAITSGSVKYDGKYKALEYLSATSTKTTTGDASVSVDFGADSATLDIEHKQHNMIISGNTMSGETATGTFYGTTGNLIGGTFADSAGADATLKGVYQVGTTTDLMGHPQ